VGAEGAGRGLAVAAERGLPVLADGGGKLLIALLEIPLLGLHR
jgi:hypothetical protein